MYKCIVFNAFGTRTFPVFFRKGAEETPTLLVETCDEKNAKLARKAADIVTVGNKPCYVFLLSSF